MEGSLSSSVSQKTGFLLVFSPGLPLLMFFKTVGPTTFSAIYFLAFINFKKVQKP